MALQPSPVKKWRWNTGSRFPAADPEGWPEAQAKICRGRAEVMVVAAYGLILPQAVLDMPRLAASIFMPRCCRAGAAAPIQRALLAGDTETGVCIMQMEAGLDTGRCCCAARFRSAAERYHGHAARSPG